MQRQKEERGEICKDAANYNIQILGITETHYQMEEIEDIIIKDQNNKPIYYQIYHGGIVNNANPGAGIIIEMNKKPKPTYQKITNQIIKAGTQVKKADHMNVVVTLMATGNFNAKTVSAYPQYKHKIEKYGKSLKTAVLIFYCNLQKKRN